MGGSTVIDATVKRTVNSGDTSGSLIRVPSNTEGVFFVLDGVVQPHLH